MGHGVCFLRINLSLHSGEHENICVVKIVRINVAKYGKIFGRASRGVATLFNHDLSRQLGYGATGNER